MKNLRFPTIRTRAPALRIRNVRIFFTLCLVVGIHSAHAATYYSADFDNTDPGKKELDGGQIDNVNNPLKDATNSSDKVGRCRVNDGGKRAEYSSPRLATNEKMYVYRWMYYLPADFVTADLGWRVLSQWKTYPCEVCTNYANEICDGCGGIFDEMRVTGGNFKVSWRAKPDCRNYQTPLITGRWVSFMMEVYWTNSSKGYARLWIDGVLVREYSGIKTLFDRFPTDGSCNIYWGVGLYGPLSGRSYADVYIDNISIADVAATGSAGSPLRNRAVSSFTVRPGSAGMRIRIDRDCRAQDLTVKDLHGRLVRRMALPSADTDGSVSVTWDGTDDGGRLVPAGVVTLTAGVNSLKGIVTR